MTWTRPKAMVNVRSSEAWAICARRGTRTIPYAASITIDFREGADSGHDVGPQSVQIDTLTGNITLDVDGMYDGGIYTIMVDQDATGSRTVSWASLVFLHFGALSSSADGTPSKRTVWMFVCLDTGLHCIGRNVY